MRRPLISVCSLWKTGLLVTPGSAFGSAGEGYIRMALVVDLPVIGGILEVLEKSGMF